MADAELRAEMALAGARDPQRSRRDEACTRAAARLGLFDVVAVAPVGRAARPGEYPSAITRERITGLTVPADVSRVLAVSGSRSRAEDRPAVSTIRALASTSAVPAED